MQKAIFPNVHRAGHIPLEKLASLQLARSAPRLIRPTFCIEPILKRRRREIFVAPNPDNVSSSVGVTYFHTISLLRSLVHFQFPFYKYAAPAALRNATAGFEKRPLIQSASRKMFGERTRLACSSTPRRTLLALDYADARFNPARFQKYFRQEFSWIASFLRGARQGMSRACW